MIRCATVRLNKNNRITSCRDQASVNRVKTVGRLLNINNRITCSQALLRQSKVARCPLPSGTCCWNNSQLPEIATRGNYDSVISYTCYAVCRKGSVSHTKEFSFNISSHAPHCQDKTSACCRGSKHPPQNRAASASCQRNSARLTAVTGTQSIRGGKVKNDQSRKMRNTSG